MTDEAIIVGGGPAGLSAAIQLERYAIPARLFESDSAGGLLWNANLVENYPGVTPGISGRELAERFAAQAAACGVRVTPERVIELDWDDGFFRAATPAGAYRSRRAVIASGTRPRSIDGLEIPDALSRKVFYEVKPLLDVEGARIVVIGSGDAAFDYALNLGRKNDVVILGRGERPSSLPLLVERAAASPRIVYHASALVTSLASAPEGRLSVKCSGALDGATIEADCLICAVGRDPRIDFLSERLRERSPDLEKQGRLYYAGDVKNGMCRQTAIAAGDGILAAMRIYQSLKASRDPS
jgi:thioredoxin reductase (NADPH)